MAYNKRIRGDSNTANEEFSHNRIYIEAGISGLILTIFAIVLILAAIYWMITRNGGLFSALVILTFAGIFIGSWIVAGCYVIKQVSVTIREFRVNKILGSTVVAGEVVAHLNDEQEWDHLSSIHEQGKVRSMPQPKDEHEPLPSEAWVILDMHKQGIGFKTIAESTKWTEYAVRKLCNKMDGKIEQ